MNVLLTLDYELFFGERMGSVERCLIEPTQALLRALAPSGARLAFFVDAGYLLNLREFGAASNRLAADYSLVRRQLDDLLAAGHDIQLHVHPHWEESYWDGERWHINLRRYRLHDFADDHITDIVARYHDELARIAGRERVFVFRAGGWVNQPFTRIAGALKAVGIRIDSTVFPGGRAESATHWFDFRGAPAVSHWRFSRDPLVPDPAGEFLELPIASARVPPWFYWRMGAVRASGLRRHRPYGDGHALPPGGGDVTRKLVARTVSVVSMDGLKAALLPRAYRDYRRRGLEDFVVMGHPKALSPYSIERTAAFVRAAIGARLATYGDYLVQAASA